MVIVTTVLGDLTSAQMRLLGELAVAFGDGSVRITSDQNVVFAGSGRTDVERRSIEASRPRAWRGPARGRSPT